MIIGPDFVWLHFPKTAGTSVERALRSLFADRQDVVCDPIDPANVIWHHTISRRQNYDPTFSLGDRRVICGIRRLPYWLLSRVHFEAARPPHRIATRAMLTVGSIFEQGGHQNRAENYVIGYSKPRVEAWVRAENLVDDLAAALDLERGKVEASLTRSNASKINYIKDLSFWFTPDDLATLYEANPTWAALEKKLYGSVLTL